MTYSVVAAVALSMSSALASLSALGQFFSQPIVVRCVIRLIEYKNSYFECLNCMGDQEVMVIVSQKKRRRRRKRNSFQRVMMTISQD